MTVQQYIVKTATNAAQQHLHFTPARNVFCGLGLAYAISNDKYHHIPLTVIFPSVYIGYQAYMNRDTIRGWVCDAKKTT